MDAARLPSKQSNRSISRFSVASRASRYDDETISTSQKRKYDLPKLKVDRLDTNYNNIISGQVKKTSSVSKSMVSSNKLPTHLRGGNFYIKNQVQPTMRQQRIRNSHAAVNKSANSSVKNSLLGQNKRRYDIGVTDVSINKKLNSKYHTARKKPP